VAPNDEKRNAKLGIDTSFLVPSQKLGPAEENQGEGDIAGVDMEELENEEAGALDTENIIGPDGEKEQWKMAE